MFNFRRITLFCSEKRLSKHKMTIFSKTLGGHGPFAPPGYDYALSPVANFLHTPLATGPRYTLIRQWNKQGRRYNHAILSLVTAFPLMSSAGLASPTFPGTFCSRGRTNLAGISLFGEVARNSGFYEFKQLRTLS